VRNLPAFFYQKFKIWFSAPDKSGKAQPIICSVSSFSLLAQRKRASCGLRHTTTEKAPVSFGPSDFLALLKAAGILKARFARTVQNP